MPTPPMRNDDCAAAGLSTTMMRERVTAAGAATGARAGSGALSQLPKSRCASAVARATVTSPTTMSTLLFGLYHAA